MILPPWPCAEGSSGRRWSGLRTGTVHTLQTVAVTGLRGRERRVVAGLGRDPCRLLL